MALQPNPRISPAGVRCGLHLPDSSPVRLQQLLLLQSMHKRLWQARRSILRNRLHQEEQRRKPHRFHRIHLLPAGAPTHCVAYSFHVSSFRFGKNSGSRLSAHHCRLQLRKLAQQTSSQTHFGSANDLKISSAKTLILALMRTTITASTINEATRNAVRNQQSLENNTTPSGLKEP